MVAAARQSRFSPDPQLARRDVSRLDRQSEQHPGGGHAGHGWMMIMCVPMVVIVIVLVATSVAGVGLILGAVMCVAMMAMMMRMMSDGGEHR